jgi:hypothetical protein
MRIKELHKYLSDGLTFDLNKKAVVNKSYVTFSEWQPDVVRERAGHTNSYFPHLIPVDVGVGITWSELKRRLEEIKSNNYALYCSCNVFFLKENEDCNGEYHVEELFLQK